MFNSLLALASIAALSNAYSIPTSTSWPHGDEWKSTLTLPLNEIVNTEASPLPTPSSAPKYVLLGLGFQNYTCDATKTWVQTVPSSGAVADLYDISHIVTSQSGNIFSASTLKAFERCLKVTRCSPNAKNGYCDQCHDIAASAFDRNYVGEHFFDQVNGVQTPNFNIEKYGDFISAKKAGSAAAPEDAYDGENGLGAVDWLYLIDNGSGRTHGLKSVYRVETAGGVAPETCEKEGSQLQVPYAAEYWFYD